HTDLLSNGQLEDPFFRDNELKQMWVGESDWHYWRSFEVDESLLKHERIYLCCHGLDTIALIQVNGETIAHTDNMFRIYWLDVTSKLQQGTNTIDIFFESPIAYSNRMDAEKGAMAGWVEPMRISTGAWIRKEPCNFGWDWGPKMPTSGIWRSIELVAFSIARITDVFILQKHSQNQVELEITTTVEQLEQSPLYVTIDVFQGETFIESSKAYFEGNKAVSVCVINEPKLWWPHGMGEHPLYTIKVNLYGHDLLLDSHQKKIGLRTITLERHPNEKGETFYFACNGVPFFAKGANWIPASPYPSATTDEQYRKLIKAAVDANMNMLRVWGGGIYEQDVFYEICDELGITIWQDFMFACGTYPSFDNEFMANVKAEAEDNVRRLRHHACIALWCGNNEIEQGLSNSADWIATMSWEDYSRLFDDLLADVVGELAPQTSYWPGSPHSPCGERTNWENPNCGDTHLWAVWHGKQPFEWYRTRTDRFCSEFGFQSFPQPDVIYEITLPEDRNITSYIMEHHQRSAIGNSTIIHYMLDWFRLPTSFESLLWLSQILQGMAIKYAVEHWRRNMPHTMGTLYWQLNDMWPAPSWSSLDWKGNWKALHYMARRFYAPLLISGVEDRHTQSVGIYFTSDLQEDISAKIRWKITDLHGLEICTDGIEILMSAHSTQCVHTLNVAPYIKEYGERSLLVWLEA
ncbi:MAG: hypothetical protein CUN55_14415, partial [Phototrophicales bacterium]